MEVSLHQHYPPPAPPPTPVKRKPGSRALHASPSLVKAPGTSANRIVLDPATAHGWRSTTNVYIKGLPENCVDENLHQWAAVVAEPVSVKTIREAGQEQKCTGIGFVRFFETSHASAFLQMVSATMGFEACFAKETYVGKMDRAADTHSANLYLSHIPLSYDEDDVAALFPPNRYNIQSLRLLREGDQPHRRADSTAFRGAGFVRLATRSQADEAIAELNGKYLPGHHRMKNGYFETLQVRFADTDAQKVIKDSVRNKPVGSSRWAMIASGGQQSTMDEMPSTPPRSAGPSYRSHAPAPSPFSPQTPAGSTSLMLSDYPVMSPDYFTPQRSYSSSPETLFTSLNSSTSYSSPATSRGSPTLAKHPPTMPCIRDLPPHMSIPSAPRLPSVTTFPPVLPTFPLPPYATSIPATSGIPPPALGYPSDPAIAALIASAYQQGQSDAHVQQALSATLLQQHQQLQMHSQQLQETILHNQQKLDAAHMSGGHGIEDPMSPFQLDREQEQQGYLHAPSDTSSSLAEYRFGANYGAEGGNEASSGSEDLVGLGISNTTLSPQTPSSKHNRPRAYTTATSADSPSKHLAPASALGRRSSAIEERIARRKESMSLVPAVLSLRKLSTGSASSASLSASMSASPAGSSNNSPRPSISVESIPSPAHAERSGTGKVILPFSKAIRSFSVAAGVDDSGFHDSQPEEEYQFPKHPTSTTSTTRRGSHLGTGSSVFIPEQGRLVHQKSNGSVQKTLRETFSTMSLRNGSTAEEQEEEQQPGRETSLTVIKPGFTFGNSHHAAVGTSASSSSSTATYVVPALRRLSAAQQPSIEFSSLEGGNGARMGSIKTEDEAGGSDRGSSRRGSGFTASREEDIQTEYMLGLLGGKTS